jgi:2-C-methyl-D-erythritol 4-phosphate cytidylyltransferase/2-C-methyl-D-erythritol 2,4-cyclodiphosphate synthase
VVLADEDAGWELDEPPALVRVLGRTLLELCAETIDVCPGIHGFIVVVPVGTEDRAADSASNSPKFLGAVPGGTTIRESVVAGVEALPPGLEPVVWHEVTRPLASPELFAAVLQALEGADVAVTQVPVGDTVKRVDTGMVRETIPRAGLGVAQTPQGFRRAALAANNRGDERGPMDRRDHPFLPARAGLRVAALPGDPANLKVRTSRDLRLVERLLAERITRGHGR